ncbi:MAG: hypothetical protein H6672_22520 [Anaerolineaceae bacterium]|nr:hypothetical protein [Anaerolineaceae bacterium]
MPREPYRIMQKFWLDVTKDTEYELAAAITDLKKNRSYTAAVRDGLRLILDLRAGKLDVLIELFPWIKDAIKPQTATQEDDLKRELVALREAVMARGGGGYSTPPRRLVSDAEMPDVVMKPKTGTDAAANFLASLKGLQNL